MRLGAGVLAVAYSNNSNSFELSLYGVIPFKFLESIQLLTNFCIPYTMQLLSNRELAMHSEIIVDDFEGSVTFRLVPDNDREKEDLRRLTKALSRKRFRKPVLRTLLHSSEDDVIFTVR